MRARMVACILSRITLNVVQIVISQWGHFKIHGGTLFFSLIIKLCRRVKVEDYPADTWVQPKTHIFPLKIQGDGAHHQSKRKINLGKSTQEDTDFYRPSSANPIDEISGEIWVINELVSKLP